MRKNREIKISSFLYKYNVRTEEKIYEIILIKKCIYILNEISA